MRHVRQPGPVEAHRIEWCAARGRAFQFKVPAGALLLDGVRQGFAAAGFASGVMRMQDGALGPFGYVMPALSETPDHAAFYSAIHRPAGLSRIETAALTLGMRDGRPFFHCHGLWSESDGRRSGGHMLPDETVVAEPFVADAVGIDGAVFSAYADPETNFTLFGPVSAPARATEAPARLFALRLRPNVDVSTALEAFCRERRLTGARVHGGVGSIIGARYADGVVSEPFATEMAITQGEITPDAGGGFSAAIDAALIDYTGARSQGRLVRGDNPVLMTLELVLEATG